jgi:hypothetical protein
MAPAFHLPETLPVIPFPFPDYTLVSCLDTSMWNTKNLGIF